MMVNLPNSLFKLLSFLRTEKLIYLNQQSVRMTAVSNSTTIGGSLVCSEHSLTLRPPRVNPTPKAVQNYKLHFTSDVAILSYSA